MATAMTTVPIAVAITAVVVVVVMPMNVVQKEHAPNHRWDSPPAAIGLRQSASTCGIRDLRVDARWCERRGVRLADGTATEEQAEHGRDQEML
jgi:hypothetical protein